MTGHVRVCVDCGDRRSFRRSRFAQALRCKGCALTHSRNPNGTFKPERVCVKCGRVDEMGCYYTPAQLAKLSRQCMSCARAEQTVTFRTDIDDEVVRRLVDGIGVNSYFGERITAAAILHLRGASASGIARRLGVSIRTAERYVAEIKANA